jgi:hypothetical protein
VGEGDGRLPVERSFKLVEPSLVHGVGVCLNHPRDAASDQPACAAITASGSPSFTFKYRR